MSTLSDLETTVRLRRRELDAKRGQAQALESRESALREEIESLQNEIVTLDKTSIVLTSLGEERQLKAQSTIEELVTRGLQEIFDDSLSFHIVQNVKAKAAAVEFVVRTTLADGSSVDTPVMDARGGGLAATIGFLLRVVILLLQNGKDKDNTLVLDETFAHVSAEYLPNVATFLRELVDRTGIQIVMITHQDELSENADVVYRFHTENGKTVVTQV